MKWFHLLLIAVAVLPFTACEKHPVSDLSLVGVQMEQGKQAEPGKAPAASGTSQQFFPDSK